MASVVLISAAKLLLFGPTGKCSAEKLPLAAYLFSIAVPFSADIQGSEVGRKKPKDVPTTTFRHQRKMQII